MTSHIDDPPPPPRIKLYGFEQQKAPKSSSASSPKKVDRVNLAKQALKVQKKS
jgi:hypothetical protein